MPFQRRGCETFPTYEAIPGPRTNDAMAGLLAHRSKLQAAFPRCISVAFDLSLPADSCGYSAGFTPASLLAVKYNGTIDKTNCNNRQSLSNLDAVVDIEDQKFSPRCVLMIDLTDAIDLRITDATQELRQLFLTGNH